MPDDNEKTLATPDLSLEDMRGYLAYLLEQRDRLELQLAFMRRAIAALEQSQKEE